MLAKISIIRLVVLGMVALITSCRTPPRPQGSKTVDPHCIQFDWRKNVYRVQVQPSHSERYATGNQVTMTFSASWKIRRFNLKTGAFDDILTLSGQGLSGATTVQVAPTTQLLHFSQDSGGGGKGASGIPGVFVSYEIITSPPSNTNILGRTHATAEIAIKFGAAESPSDEALVGAELRIPFRWMISKDTTSPHGLRCDFVQ